MIMMMIIMIMIIMIMIIDNNNNNNNNNDNNNDNDDNNNYENENTSYSACNSAILSLFIFKFSYIVSLWVSIASKSCVNIWMYDSINKQMYEYIWIICMYMGMVFYAYS